MGKLLPPILNCWEKYPEEIRKLLSDPLTAAVEELEKANKSDDWNHVELATTLLSFLIKETIPLEQ